MENEAIVLFKVESEGYQAFARVEQAPVAQGYAVSQFDLVKREGERLVPCNRGDSGINTSDDTLKGGLVGTLVGILGGPVGILLGGATGALIGTALDADDAVANQSLVEMAATKLYDGESALIALVQEDAEDRFDKLFGGLDCTIIRRMRRRSPRKSRRRARPRPSCSARPARRCARSARPPASRKSSSGAPRSRRASRSSRQSSNDGSRTASKREGASCACGRPCRDAGSRGTRGRGAMGIADRRSRVRDIVAIKGS